MIFNDLYMLQLTILKHIYMKHLKQLLILVLLTFIGIGQMWADYSYTFESKQFSANESAVAHTLGSVSWNHTCSQVVASGKSAYWGYDATKGQQWGSGNAQASVTLSTSGISGSITQVSINASIGNSGGASLSVTVGGNTFKYNNNNSVSPTTTATTYNFTGTGSGTIIITYNSTVKKAIYMKSIAVTASSGGGSGKQDLSSNQLAWSAASATVTKDGNNNVYPTLTNSVPVTVSYSSTNTNVATINSSGDITLVKGGTTTIKATFAGNNTYNEKEVSYTLTVNKPTIEGGMTDEITITTTGVTSNSYTAFSGKSASNTGHSSAVYAGKVIKNTNDIQLNTIGSADNATGRGVASTTSGGLVKRVEVIWGSTSMTNGRKVSIYGSNTAYTGTETAVVSANKLGDITYATGATSDYFDIEGSYKYVQLVVDGAAYVNKFNITWVAPPTYAINKSTTGCTLTVQKGGSNVTSAAEGDEISVSATANTGRNTPSISVKDADNNPVTVANGKFTMPAKAVTVTATASMTDYTVTVNKSPNISATTTGQTTTAHYNGTINLTTTVPSGYAFVNWTTTDGFSITNATSATTASFTMPAKNVAVTANFRKLVQSITVKNGDANVAGQTIEMTVGDEINLSVVFDPSDAYDKSLTWTSGDDTKATLSNGTLTAIAATTSNVTMTVSTPDLNTPVTFYVKVNEPVGNTVTLTQPTLGGTVDASPKGEVDEGDEVTLSYSALSTHEFVAWIVKDEDEDDVAVTNNKFTMPDKSVTVTASFRPKAPVFTLEAGSYEGDQVVKLTSFDGDHFLYYYTLNGNDPDGNSTSYDDNTAGIVLSEDATLKMIIYDEEIQASAITTADYTITHTPSVLTLSANGNTYTFDQDNTHYLNEVVQLPNDIPNNYKIAGKVFKGWSSVAITTPSAEPTSNFYQPGGDYTLSTAASTLYAVYATEEAGATTWTRVTAINTLTGGGTFIMGYEGEAKSGVIVPLRSADSNATTSANGYFNTGTTAESSTSGTIDMSTVTSTSDYEVYISSPATGKINIQMGTSSGNYYGATSGGTTSNKARLYTSGNSNETNLTPALASETNNQFSLTADVSGSYKYLKYNTGSPRFAYYNSAGEKIVFYKKGSGPATYKDYVTTVATYAITEATCENGEVEADVTTATAGATITITAAGAEGYALLAFDVYKTGASATKVDFTVDPNNYKQATFSMPAYAVTVSATFIKVGTAENPLTVAELIASQANLDGYYVYAQGVVSQLGSFNSTYGYYTYYFSADGTTTSQFEVYNGYKGSHQEEEVWYYDGFENASDLALGDEVTVEGYIKYFNNTKYQFEAQNSELTYHCRPVVVTKGAESNGTFTITANEETITDSKKYCLADLSGANDLTVTVAASPASGYRLKSITSAAGTVGTISNNTCTITGIKASTTINATFEQVFAVALAVDATGTHQSCSTTINGGAGPVNVAAGETINLVASLTDSENDEFVNFTATTGITITPTGDLTATATATQAGTITANFRPLADPHTITNGGVNAAYGTIFMKDMENNVAASLSLRPDKTGKLVAEEEEGYRFTGWTVTPANAVTFADATAMETTFAATDVAATISATYEARTAFTVKFMNGNSQIGDDAMVYDGRTIDLLGTQTSFDANHTRFCGWVKNSFEGIADAEPSFVSGAQTIDNNTTFYAVYGNAVETNNYGKITEAAELESGKNYLIVAEYNNGLEALHAAELSKEYWLKTGVVTADNNVIASTVAERTWQISVNAGVAHVYNAKNEKYLGVNYVSSGDHYNARIFDDAYDLTIAPNDGAWNISGVSNTKTVYVIHAPGYQEYIGSNAAAPVDLYKQLYESDEWVSLPVEYVSVTFDKHAGSETVTNMPANITGQMKGYSLTEPSETPERAGYNFIGWNTDNEATEPMSFPQTINTNTTVYAIWQAYPDCAIDLYVNGVKDDDISTSVKQGAELDLSAIDAPERLGYDFLGWAANPRAEENTTAIATIDAYTPTPNVDTQKSFYAVYTRTEGEAQYEKVTSEPTDWSGKYLIVCEDQNIAFDGSWDELDNAGNNFEVTIDESVIAYSEVTDAKTFTIAAVTGGYSIKSKSGYYVCGKGSGTNGMNSSTSTEYVNTISLTNDDNATIIGDGAYMRCNANNGNPWFRYFKSTTYTSQDPIQLYKYIAGTTYYTTNPAVNYNVSYNLAGGAWKEDEGCESAIVEANGNYDVCEDVPVKTDYIFTGWTVGGEAIGASITVTETTEIVANYRAAETYSVTYDANGALGTAPAATPVKEGASYTVLGNTWFFKAGYSFTGWNTAEDGSGMAYAKDAIMTMPSENVTLYAQWSNSISERDVVIVAHYGDKYYAMGQTLSSGQLNAVQVQMLNGKVRDVAEENRADITWHMIVNSSNNTVSFYSPDNEKYLGAGSSTNLALSEEAVEWTWDNEKKCYKIGETAKTFWYRNTESGKDPDCYNFFKYYSTTNVGANGYASEMILAYGFAVTIDGDATESALTIGDDVVVTEDAELTINSERVLNSLTVEAGGSLKLNDGAAKKLIVNDLTINTQSGASGQVTGTNAQVTGDLYLEIKLCDGDMDATASRKWYCIAAPFDVNMDGGFFWGDGTPMVLNTDFQLFEWDGDRRATGISGWKRVSGVMKAGIAYFIGFDDERSNQNIIKLKATNKSISNKSNINAPEHSSSVDDRYANWNGLANPNFHYIALDKDVQAFDHSAQGYNPYESDEYNFVVGTPFFIKETGDITIEAADNGAFRAPKREVEQLSYCVRIARDGKAGFDNQMYVRASEEASASYEEGHDLVTMNNETSNYGALLWTVNYGGKRMAIEEAPLVNNKAVYALSLYAPATGIYRIETPTTRMNADLYLTYEGAIIWNLSESAYPIDLKKGTTEGYGLLLVKKVPMTPTGIDEVQGNKVQCTKVILDEKVFILRGGQMYDVTGKAVR